MNLRRNRCGPKHVWMVVHIIIYIYIFVCIYSHISKSCYYNVRHRFMPTAVGDHLLGVQGADRNCTQFLWFRNLPPLARKILILCLPRHAGKLSRLKTNGEIIIISVWRRMEMMEWYFWQSSARTDSRIENTDNWDLFYARNFETCITNTTKLLRNAWTQKRVWGLGSGV